MKITPTTTLGELELRFRSFGVTCFLKPDSDTRVYCLISNDETGISGEAYGASLDEAIDSALATYQINAFGPKPTKEKLS